MEMVTSIFEIMEMCFALKISYNALLKLEQIIKNI